MKFSKLLLKDTWLIEPNIYEDSRGSFRRSFCQEKYKEYGLESDMSQGNISENTYKGTLRGFHYQIGKHKEAKTITCINGSVYDVVIDLRKDSPTYLKHTALEISSINKKSIYVPKGCANAWLTLEPNTIIHYYMSNSYKPGFDYGIRYDDPFFDIKWPFLPEVISQKDQNYNNFDFSVLP